jgi:hypothetical protein
MRSCVVSESSEVGVGTMFTRELEGVWVSVHALQSANGEGGRCGALSEERAALALGRILC